ncbi:general substrate transporter [Aspergillus sclerotioniger CBS 115572]|uniref:General substrate transporter n=1 Tax=Aspergillus sclerotioniger CBS 115572 TaxID=1450535 RepID=A0A317X7R8_9EURO|nr:general substrate transporter [Aspergillus sclerotioniger CBS 115572]PWY94335.1 general substrate transporter [Aspergillus sclerotioniger CBS 115572]
MGLIAETRKAIQDSPRGVFNWYLLLNTAIFALSGISRGFDEGNIACLVVQSQFRIKFGLDQQSPEQYANTKGWIVSIFTAGMALGCLACLPFNDRIGRRWTMRLSTLVYVGGILGQGLCNGNLAGLYVSRLISGLGVGGMTVTPPMYISEIAPKTIRGLLALQYTACQQLGVVFGFFINYSITKTYDGTDMQWMFPTLIQLLPAAIWGLGMLTCEESPRWLLYVGRRTQAVLVLARLRHLPRNHPTVVTEIAVMEYQILQEREAVTDASQWRLLKETFVPVENRRRFFLVFMAHLFSQWSGGNAITQYLPTILGYLGTSGDTASLTTGIYAAVKFACVLVFSLVIVDFVGRRRSLMAGITLQITTLAYLACYLGITRGMTTTALLHAPSASRASTGAIAAIFLHGVGWVIGWFSMPFLIGAEIFPIRIRSLAVSMGMACHWLFAFGCSRATPDLLEVTHEWGAFAFFACICLVSLVYVFFAMPDTTGRSLEALDGLFQRPWYTVYQVAYAKEEDEELEVQAIHERGKSEMVGEVE